MRAPWSRWRTPAAATVPCGRCPQGAAGFTTIELKSNFLGSARDGVIQCTARPLHQGRTTQVWDAVVAAEGSAKPIAQFRCTQMILWPKA